MDRDVIVNEIVDAHSMYYSLRGAEASHFDININGVEMMNEKELLQLLKMLHACIKDELNKY